MVGVLVRRHAFTMQSSEWSSCFGYNFRKKWIADLQKLFPRSWGWEFNVTSQIVKERSNLRYLCFFFIVLIFFFLWYCLIVFCLKGLILKGWSRLPFSIFLSTRWIAWTNIFQMLTLFWTVCCYCHMSYLWKFGQSFSASKLNEWVSRGETLWARVCVNSSMMVINNSFIN